MARKTIIRRKDIVIAGSLAALVVAVVVVVQLMLIAPAVSVSKRRAAKVVEAAKKLDDNVRKRRNLGGLVKQNEELKTRLAVFDKRVCSKTEVAALFADVLRLADQGRLKILLTRPAEPTSIGQGFLRFAYELDVQGEYHQLALFISGVESHASFMEVAGATFSGAGDEGLVRMKVTLYLYGFVAETASPAEPATS